MERSLIRQVNRKNMAARLNTRHVKPMYFPNFFGIKSKTSLKWETLTGEKGAPVIADVISFDASAPQKTREVIGKLSGDIPKTSIKRGMNESDYNDYIQLERDAQGDAAQMELLDLAFKDQDFCYNGVRGRFEWWCMQMMSKAGFVLNANNNAGIVTAEFVGCGMPAANRRVSTVDWATAATADGLQDIDDVVEYASTRGVTIRYVVMHTSDFSLLKKQTATINKIKSWINTTTKVTVTKKVINEYLAEQERPVQIVTVSPALRVENKAHVRSTINPWERKRICFLEDLNVGDIQHGPIAAERSAAVQKVAMMVKQDFVLITKWSELEPFKEWTKAEANAFPVVNDPDAMFILKADAIAWNVAEDTEGTDNIPAKFLGEDVEQESNEVEE
ncbi:MAG: major capsid protein [Mangrovibacterium sp.]